MGKLRNISFLCAMTVMLVSTLLFVQLIPQNATNMQENDVIVTYISDSTGSLEDTFNYIIKRLNTIRNSESFDISEDITTNSYNLKATAGDESISVDESYQVKNIVKPHPTNQSLTTQIIEPTKNNTNAQIIMGFTYQLIKYKWEISWTLELFGFKIAYAYFGIEIDIGAAMRFPIELNIDYFTNFLINQETSVNVTLETLDLPAFDETYFHFIGRIYAGVNAFGQKGEWSLGPNYREDRSYETPLGAGTSVDLGTVEIPILEILGQLSIPYVSQIANIIASYVADFLVKLRFGIGSSLISMKAAVYGNVTAFDGPTGQTFKTLNFTQSGETESLIIYAQEPGPIRLELSDFKYHLNRLDITILLGLTWKTVFAYIFDDMEWEIYSFSIPLGNLFVFSASNTITVQLNASSLTPSPPSPETYGVNIIYISPTESIECGKQVAEYYVFIENTGSNIEQDLYDIEVTGIDASWVIHPPYITIKQGNMGYFIVKLDPQRDYLSSAGIHPFTVTVRSRGDSSKVDSIAQDLNILPFYEANVQRISLLDTGILDIDPEIAENITFLVQNTGNIAENFSISMRTNGLSSSIFEVPSSVILAPGESTIINANITVPRSSQFPALRYSVKLIAQSQTDPTFQAFDTVQMNILPFRNLSITISEFSAPEKIRAGSKIVYNVFVENNGNFNDTIELSLLGLQDTTYEFGIEHEILFPSQTINTTLTLTIPSSTNALKSEEFNLTFIAQFESDEAVSFTSSIVFYTTPNYLPLIILLIAIGSVVASVPFIYRKTAPYVRRKLNARTVRKYLQRSDEGMEESTRIKLDTCPYCHKELTKGELNALNSNLDTLCEKCGKLLRADYLEVSVPKQKSIDEVVSSKMKAYKMKQEEIVEKKKTDQRIKQYKTSLTKKISAQTAPRKIEIEYCPHCFNNLSETDISILKKGDMTFCSHCRKILKPEDFGK